MQSKRGKLLKTNVSFMSQRDRDIIHRGRVVGILLPRQCPAVFSLAEAAAATKTILATPALREQMTRYVASIDEKVEILTINLRLTNEFRGKLLRAR